MPDRPHPILDQVLPEELATGQSKVSWASSAATRRTMLGNRGKDTAPELRLRRLLHHLGLRYRVDLPIPTSRRRRIDIAFTKHRLAVFVDGCFWHGCPEHYIRPMANASFWRTKVEGNMARDMSTTELLVAADWQVLRIWEHVPAETACQMVLDVLRELSGCHKAIPAHQTK